MTDFPETSGNLRKPAAEVSGDFWRFPKVSGQSVIDGPYGISSPLHLSTYLAFNLAREVLLCHS
jgi:hypothetical protein